MFPSCAASRTDDPAPNGRIRQHEEGLDEAPQAPSRPLDPGQETFPGIQVVRHLAEQRCRPLQRSDGPQANRGARGSPGGCLRDPDHPRPAARVQQARSSLTRYGLKSSQWVEPGSPRGHPPYSGTREDFNLLCNRMGNGSQPCPRAEPRPSGGRGGAGRLRPGFRPARIDLPVAGRRGVGSRVVAGAQDPHPVPEGPRGARVGAPSLRHPTSHRPAPAGRIAEVPGLA